MMIKAKVGLSQRAYSRHAHVSLAYVQRLIKAAKIPVLESGRIDPTAADAFRAKYTRIGRGQRRQGKQNFEAEVSGRGECMGCGEQYPLIASRNAGTPKFEQFCTPDCQADSEKGLSLKTIRRRIFREGHA